MATNPFIHEHVRLYFLILFIPLILLREYNIDLATPATFESVFADEPERFQLTCESQDLGDLGSDQVYNDFLLLDERSCRDYGSPFFLQWFMTNGTRSIRFLQSAKDRIYLHVTDVIGRFDTGNDREASYYVDIWHSIQHQYMGGSWMKLLHRNKAVSINANDYLEGDAIFRLVALHLLRHIEKNTFATTDFEILRIMYTLRIVTHPDVKTAPVVSQKAYTTPEPPIVILADDDLPNMLRGYVYINFGTTQYVQVGIWHDSLSALQARIYEQDGEDAQVRVWAYQNCEVVLDRFKRKFDSDIIDLETNVFARDNFAAYEHFLKTFFEEHRAGDTSYIKEWVRGTGDDIQYEVKSDAIMVHAADIIRLFCRLSNRTEAEEIIKIMNNGELPDYLMMTLPAAMRTLHHQAIMYYPIPKLIAKYEHDLSDLFSEQVPIVEVEVESSINGGSTARNMSPNDFLELRRLELKMDPNVRIAECNAREAEARAQEAKYRLEQFRLERETISQPKPVARTPSPPQVSPLPKKRKVVTFAEKVKDPARCTIFKIPKRLAAKMATASIIRINNQDRKAHTKTNDKIITDAIDHTVV